VGGGGDEEGEAFAGGAGGRGEDGEGEVGGEGSGGVGLGDKKIEGQKGNYWGYRRRFGGAGRSPHAQFLVFANYGPKWKPLRKLANQCMLGGRALNESK